MASVVNQHDEVIKMLGSFVLQFITDMEAAKASGAVPAGTTDVSLARAVMQITAERFGPISTEQKELLANLKCFI
jgi:hypothetical protein